MIQYWKKNLPSHVESQMVDFQGTHLAMNDRRLMPTHILLVHDFHTPQPVANAAVFMLRHIVHNWSDERVVKILRHLRDAAQPTTQHRQDPRERRAYTRVWRGDDPRFDAPIGIGAAATQLGRGQSIGVLLGRVGLCICLYAEREVSDSGLRCIAYWVELSAL
ncbi:S-adenosyl-L-methionine-dependent methyltransferase [Mycena sanguinolenta]|uniref:S-adenosyl-L-methionine-dependent methyltransferase n=1 Tax=Mycena sanguinolenta TaxID=230812 RepID=A0A8H6Y033_9AGAR|nr:S-adenosyl-L-methionine-dependent methyltransferase [Mycena sanguinolenta]